MIKKANILSKKNSYDDELNHISFSDSNSPDPNLLRKSSD